MQRQQKITLGEMRSGNGPRRLLVYCSDHKCPLRGRSMPLPGVMRIRLSDLEPKFTCKACGRRGANVRSGAHGHWVKLPIGGIFNLRNR